MVAKQLSIFIENRKGRLEEVLLVLKNNDINILSLSLADTEDYGLLRLIVDKPELGKEQLNVNGFKANITNVLAVKVEHKVGGLQDLLKYLSDESINVEYMYALAVNGDGASIVFKTSNVEKAVEVLSKRNCTMLSNEDIVKMSK